MRAALQGCHPLMQVPAPSTDLPRPFRPHAAAEAMYKLHHVLDRHIPIWPAVGHALQKSPRLYKLFTAVERRSKKELFGCRMCGQCALPVTGYACPMTCPKQLRNGPCGGVGSDGSCEVYPDLRCVWLVAFERAEAAGRAADLDLLQRPIDHRAWRQSSWVNYWSGRDDDLWTTGASPAAGRR